ncbi:rab GTPase-binding effector protein 1-like [Actinia tenebrosa]|uniref:Rab GTPase-binding effector protein 1-like n=1 Tax=Actinia tenebrosa TaxID=6105 RepID=A0A6P8HGA1_ACTTE|nr:rab GTPase-binding effector protein 1-like [Actinia tenebrosa]
MDEDLESSSTPLPEDVDNLKAIVLELRKKEKQLLQEKQQAENDFGKKRAMLKDIFISKEEELEALQKRFDEVVNECETLRTATSVLESAQSEEISSLTSKYQEEIASLQHIMREAVKEARDTTAQQFELERHSLISANQKLEAQLKDLHAKLGHDGKNTGVMSAMTDAVAGVVRRSTSLTSTSHKEKEPVSMEEGMKKVQEDAEGWKTIVKALEEENSFLKSKLRSTEEKLQGAEKPTMDKESSVSLDELQEKVKDLNLYLECERASRTDLEIYVSVLNTQKGVLQDDSDKLRKELHNVCKLLEQEKTAHRELKQTWQMANDQFLENQQMLNAKMTLMWNVMTNEQKQKVREERQKLLTTRPQAGELVDLTTPPLTPVSPVEKAIDVALTIPDSGSHLSDISTLSCTNSITSIASDKEESNDEDEDGDNKHKGQRQRSHSDSGSLEVNDIDVSRAKSAENLTPLPLGVQDKAEAEAIRHSPLLDLEPRPRTPSKGKIDWRVFQEEVKVLHESETNRSCVMCSNYEKQLQKVEAERQKLKNLSSNLQIALEHEKKALFEEQKLRSRLELSVGHAGQDAQTQINEQADMLSKLDKILVDVQRNYAATRKEASAQIEKLTVSRDELREELNRLRSEYIALQDSALQQLSQMDSDARVTEMKEQLMQIRSASEGTEEKLRSEIAFLKDRAIAEQMNKDSMEEMFQADVEGYKIEIGKLAEDFKKERKEKEEMETKLQQSDQMLRNIEAKSKTVIIALRGQLEEASEEKKKLEVEMNRMRNQFQSLTSQLNESETVQRDFVKLSQSLQMQIAKIQESEEDVRWEHKDDVHQCHKCKKPLANNKDKAHCHHCGKIFCEACRSKTINSSVTRRAHQVCDLCHAILSKDPKALVNDISDGDR